MSNSNSNQAVLHPSRALVLGIAGEKLTNEEAAFFAKVNPLGFILFARNCKTADQITALVEQLQDAVGRADVPVLIDQEGGRVARLRPPLFRACPPAQKFADLAEQRSVKEAAEAAYINARLIGKGLSELGITVNCAPVADLLFEDAHEIIGDRSYGASVEQVVALSRAVCLGLIDAGITPIIKHIPGHGRAFVDSHEALPVVNTDKVTLMETDFAVFRQLADCPWAMTAHIIYSAIDPDLPATLSPKVLKMVREEIGFKGIIISDDLSMKALKGSFADRTMQAAAAGCDIILHCNGNMAEMQEIAAAAPMLSESAIELLAGQQKILSLYKPFDQVEAEERLTGYFEAVA